MAKDESGLRLVLFRGGPVRLQTTDHLRRALEHNLRYRPAGREAPAEK